MMGRDEEVTPEDALQHYRDALTRSQELYLFNLYNFLKVAECAKEAFERKNSKYLPKEEDKNFSAKIYENDLVKAMIAEKKFLKLCAEKGLDKLINDDSLRSYYKGFADTKEYKKYLYESDGKEADRDALLSLYRHLSKDETYQEDVEDHFPTWEDDRSLVIGAMKKTIKSLPESPELYRTFRPDYEASVEFGEAMLQKVIEIDAELEALIDPALENWDMDRVATIDMILLKMAIAEFLHCPTIPTKVTLNEYVELAKMYSTDKSKDFINGILDKMMKKLDEDGKIVKEGRGLTD